MTTNQYPAETVEYIYATAYLNGTATTAGVKSVALPRGVRPGPGTIFGTPAIVGSQVATLISGLAIGPYRLWLQITAAPETVILNAGDFSIV